MDFMKEGFLVPKELLYYTFLEIHFLRVLFRCQKLCIRQMDLKVYNNSYYSSEPCHFVSGKRSDEIFLDHE